MKPDKQTLIILSPGFPRDEADTSCLPAHQAFIRALNENFPLLNICILSFTYPFFSSSYHWYGNTVTSFNGTKKGKVARLILWRRVWKRLNTLKKENNIIGLFSFWLGECAVVGKYFGKKNGIKHYCWVTGQDAKKGNKYVKLFHPKKEELVAMSDFLTKEFYKNYGIEPLKVIPNGIYSTSFPKQTAEKDIDILAAGSLIPLKQYDIFIEVIDALSKKINPLRTMLCGKGPEEMQLKKMIDDFGLQNIISLTGEKPHAEILKLMLRAKIFLHTSCYEGFSTVCLEALYAGCRVISFIQPMQHDIAHWHIVQTKEDMIEKAAGLLQNLKTEYSSVLVYSMDDTAKAVMQLFY